MRVAVLSSSYPTIAEPVASFFLHDWVTALTSRGHEVTVVAPCDRHGRQTLQQSGRLTLSFFQYGQPHWQTLAYGGGMFDNVRRNPLRLWQLPQFLRTQYQHALCHAQHADVLHAHWLFPAGFIASLVKQRTGVPLIVSIHSTDFHLLRSVPGGRSIARRIVREADRLHFVTEYHRRRFFEWLGEDEAARVATYVVPMGVHDSLTDAPSHGFGSEPRIGFIGRLVPIKGVDRLLQACAQLGRVAGLRVAGTGPARDSLVRLARVLKVDAQFIGSVRGTAKLRFLDSCDVLVFPSRHYASGRSEGLPVSLLEALARGRVVVASDSGGIPEVIRHEQNGYLFAAQSTRELRAVLASVLGSWDSARRVGFAASRTGRGFTASALAQRHEDEYRTLLAASAQRVVTA
jgi:glycosyltransferase involved in cell wall biosynthesis